ncbi:MULTISPECIES: hypothetical protein [Agrobacterium]|uniref:hypothetical protein n=1 Tax=Agrobacterium TaxID=357 RepID=UPI0022B83A83|nr:MULTISPECIES: hypothetical protein [Agrobacterium]MCZ7886284.1 hypothetical protein [Agrobacterium salinitolerans]MDA5629494.1 hypothetical protein [Agrobacterium sp. ST15.16.055]MDA6979494.1 hypothetical protein [Agrobacterium salinitolerans]
MRILHQLISLITAAAVPMAVTWTSGETGFEFIVLGAAMGFAYWYWGPTGAPL